VPGARRVSCNRRAPGCRLVGSGPGAGGSGPGSTARRLVRRRLPHTEADQARRIAERLRTAVAAADVGASETGRSRTRVRVTSRSASPAWLIPAPGCWPWSRRRMRPCVTRRPPAGTGYARRHASLRPSRDRRTASGETRPPGSPACHGGNRTAARLTLPHPSVRRWPAMRMNMAVNGLAADEYESSVVINIELNRHAESTMASNWTSQHCIGRGAPHGGNRWQGDDRWLCPDRYSAAAARSGLCDSGPVTDSRPVCRGRQASDDPSARGSGPAGACAQVRDGGPARAWG
jgi:hypothetical protein